MAAKRAVTIGFATLDYVVELSEKFLGAGTRRIKHFPGDAWPRVGGAALYTTRQLASRGIDAAPITWTGTDEAANQYRVACELSDVRTAGIESLTDSATPVCILIYQPDGDYGCLFEPGVEPREFTESQKTLIKEADLVMLAAGPPGLAEEILRLVQDRAVVAWIAKTDDQAYPKKIRALYSARADYIFCNSGEREFVDSSFADPRRVDQVIIETHGSNGVLIDCFGRTKVISVRALHTLDTTGAGDTFAGATMARILSDGADLSSAVAAGIEKAASLLAGRT